MATNFNVSALADFTAANPQKALELMILTGKGLKDYFDIETGVKYRTKIPYITNVDLDISTGAIAGYNTGSGSTTITEVVLEDAQLKIFETYTKEALNKTMMAFLGTRGTDPAELPAEEMILALKQKKLFYDVEYLLWQDASAKIPNGGVLKQITDASTYTALGLADTAFTSMADASILQWVNAVATKQQASFPEYTMEETILAMSPSNLAAYGRALYNLNGTITMETVGADGKGMQEIYIPGTMIKAVAMVGLNGSNELVWTNPTNIIEVVDLVDETDFLSFQYNPYARWHELAAQFKLGVKVADVTKVIKTN